MLKASEAFYSSKQRKEEIVPSSYYRLSQQVWIIYSNLLSLKVSVFSNVFQFLSNISQFLRNLVSFSAIFLSFSAIVYSFSAIFLRFSAIFFSVSAVFLSFSATLLNFSTSLEDGNICELRCQFF